MNLAIIIIIAIAVLFFIFKLLKFGMKIMTTVVLVVAVILTISLCVASPKMHKQFSIDIVDYIIKFNDDGTATTTKQTTRTIMQKKEPASPQVTK